MPLTIPAMTLFSPVALAPTAYVLLWSGSLMLSIVLVVLLRTRWGQSRPFHKCAVLSLLVHLLLAWAAMTVRFIAGDGAGGGSGPSIRVRIVNDGNPGLSLAHIAEDSPADAPPLLEPPPDEAKTPPAAEAQASDTKKDEPPPIAEPAKPKPKQEIAAAETPVETPPLPQETIEPTDVMEVVDTSVTSEPESEGTPTPSEAAVVAATPSTAAPSPPAAAAPSNHIAASTPYSLRSAPGRLGLVERQGGNAQTEAAVAAALRWLAAAQSNDGRWDANQFGAGQEQAVLGHNRGGAGRNADTGISGLALLAFLGAGHSHLQGEYQDTVRRGLDFLLRNQAADGNLFGNATLYAQMYCHSMATFALAEAQAMTSDRRLEPAVAKAVGFCLAAQNTTSGGWRYRPGDSGDTSQLGWQMMALASAQRAGIDAPSHTWVRVERFLQSVRRGSYGGLASYRPDSGPSTSMTAEALYCRLLLTEVRGESIEEAAATEAAAQLVANLPEAGRINLYYWYYATLALHHRQQRDDRAAADWRAWNDALTAALVTTQVTNGQHAGSWNTNTVWGGYGGRVYTTAMAAMCLEVYYRYAPPPAPRARWTATRPNPPTSR
ncbi:MAG: squalene--hopene cyclase [Pirellulales bacterium]